MKIMSHRLVLFIARDNQLSSNVIYGEEEKRSLAAQYERNIRGITMLAKRYNIDVVLVSQPSNYFCPKSRIAPDSYNIILKSLAQEHANCYFVDAKEKFSNYLDDGIIDGRLMMGNIHPTVEGQKIIAKSILEDYFVRYKIGDEFIDYNLYDYNGVWKNNIDPNFYFKMCGRYYPTADPLQCIRIGLTTLEKASVKEMREARCVWELIYYQALMEIQNGNIDRGIKLFAKSKEIYPGRSLTMSIDKYSKMK